MTYEEMNLAYSASIEDLVDKLEAASLIKDSPEYKAEIKKK